MIDGGAGINTLVLDLPIGSNTLTWNLINPNSGLQLNVAIAGYQFNGLQIINFQHFVGGIGNDVFLIKDISPNFTYNGGTGVNTLDLSPYAGSFGVTANMNLNLLTEENGLGNRTSQIENISQFILTQNNDAVIANNAFSAIFYQGNGGFDRLDLTLAGDITATVSNVEQIVGDHDFNSTIIYISPYRSDYQVNFISKNSSTTATIDFALKNILTTDLQNLTLVTGNFSRC